MTVQVCLARFAATRFEACAKVNGQLFTVLNVKNLELPAA